MQLLRAKVAFFTDEGYSPRGILHVGTHEGEEIPWYLHMGHVPVIGFEPLDFAFRQCQKEFAGNNDVMLYNCALGNHDGTLVLTVPDGNPKASARSAPIPHPDHPWTAAPWRGQEVAVPVWRLETLARRRPGVARLTEADCLVVDVQGMEMEVLEGFGDYLNGFNFLNIECSEKPIYKGETPAVEIIDWLSERGFEQKTPITSHDDIMFVRRGL